jgi:CO/xanthine dehydrogenase FAD-binding subunit
MKYFMPETINQLIMALKEKDNNTYLCAGGTDLMIRLRNAGCYHFSIIDLTKLHDIKQIEEKDGKIVIGASVTMTRLEKSEVIRENIEALAKAASMVGSTQTRNQGTIGGNIANAAQCADTMPVLFAYDANAVIINDEGVTRRCPVDELVVGLEKNSLGDKEVILYFEIEKSKDCSGFSKIGARKAVTISKVNACLKTTIIKGIIEKPIVYLGSVGVKASKAPLIEEILLGQKILEIDEDKLRIAVESQIESNIPNRSSKHYKKSAAFGILMDIINDLQDKERRK